MSPQTILPKPETPEASHNTVSWAQGAGARTRPVFPGERRGETGQLHFPALLFPTQGQVPAQGRQGLPEEGAHSCVQEVRRTPVHASHGSFPNFPHHGLARIKHRPPRPCPGAHLLRLPARRPNTAARTLSPWYRGRNSGTRCKSPWPALRPPLKRCHLRPPLPFHAQPQAASRRG